MTAASVRAPVLPELTGLVNRVVGYRLAGLRPGVHVGMPSRYLTLVLPMDAPLHVGWAGEPPRHFPSVLSGLCTRPAGIHHDGSQHGVQLDLTVAGARRLFGVPAALAETCLDLDALIGAAGAELLERVASARRGRLVLVQRLLADRVAEAGEAPLGCPEIDWAWRRLVGSGGGVPVARLAAEVGWSGSHLAARFRRELGMGPKTAARVIRFERSHQMVQNGTALAEVAAACGYADQSHLNRDWVHFAGTSPTRWRLDDEMAFVQDDRLGPG
jgi:AraC-like DNA-binding protein